MISTFVAYLSTQQNKLSFIIIIITESTLS